MTGEQLKNIIEAALMAADGTLSVQQLQALFAQDQDPPERADVRAALEQLAEDCRDRGIELQEVASGFRFQVRSEYAGWVNLLQEERPQRYSRALLETLAIIAYRQPLTRSEIEDIRGVSISSSIIKTLQEREWIRVVGHRDVPGKPELLATTRGFLDYFNLKALSELPPLSEIKDFDNINPDLFEDLEQSGESASEPEGEQTPAGGGVAEGGAPETPAVEQPAEEEYYEDEFSGDDNVVPFSN